MNSYHEIPCLAAVLLEESYVLGIEAHPGCIEFTMDLVLTQDHERFRAPGADASFCYARARLSFSEVTRCLWVDQGVPPARDASGEIDFGNIDLFEWDDAGYVLEGDWGRMEVVAQQFHVRLD